ncbi:MAG TPA: class I SAM-dependent methyltransferase [Solirubrobacteraceae bacterium]
MRSEAADDRAAELSEVSASWARVFAAFYGPVIWAGELAGMRGLRRRLLARSRGRTLELGAGTGLNVAHYPAALESLTLAEPELAMRVRLERTLRRLGREARVIDAPAERLPFEDDSIDTVVATLVLCTVSDLERSLREIARVLRADGQLLLIEHVRAHEPWLARLQDAVHGPWKSFAAGCHCNRQTAEALGAAGYELALDEVSWRLMPPIIRPLIVGRAAPPA